MPGGRNHDGDGQAQRAGLLPVHVNPVLGHIFHAVGPDIHQPTVLRHHAQELVARVHEGGVTKAATVHQLKIDPQGITQFDDSGGREREDHGLAHARKPRHGPAGDGFGPQIRPVAELPVLQLGEHHAVVLRSAGKAHTGNRQTGFHRLLFVLLKIAFDFIGDFQRLLLSGARRHENLGEEDALVLVGQIAGGQPQKQEANRTQKQNVDREVA